MLGLTAVCGSVWGAFSAETINAGNEVIASADWSPPEVTSSVIAKTQGGTPGFIRQGGTYFVYANAIDAGSPASGVASVSGDLSTISTGMASPRWLRARSRSANTTTPTEAQASTARNPLAAGTYSYSLSATDNDGNSATRTGLTVVVDNTAPTASTVQTANKAGGIAGRPEIGDTITFTFSEPIDPKSVLSGWTGAATSAVVRIGDNSSSSNDGLTVFNAANTAALPFGTVNLGRNDYVSANATFGVSGTKSTMVQSASTITITLGTASSGPRTASSSGTMVWSPSSSATDRAGNPMSTSSATESGSADKEF